jgi:hypothetical protein
MPCTRAVAWSCAFACSCAPPPPPTTPPPPLAQPVPAVAPDPAPPEKLEPGCLGQIFADRTPNAVQSGPRFIYAWWFPERGSGGSASHVVRFDAQGTIYEIHEVPPRPAKPAQPQWTTSEPLVVTIGDRRLALDREPQFGAADDRVAAFVVGSRKTKDCVLEVRDLATNKITNGAGVPRSCDDQVKAVLGANVLLAVSNGGTWRSVLVDARSGGEILSSWSEPDIVPLDHDRFALYLRSTDEIATLAGSVVSRTKLPIPPSWSGSLGAAGDAVMAIGPGGERVLLDAGGPHLLPAPLCANRPTVEPSPAPACMPADSRLADFAMLGGNVRYCTATDDAGARTCLEFDVARRRFSSLTIVAGAHSDPLDLPDLGAPRAPHLRRIAAGVEICDGADCRTLAVDGVPRALSPSGKLLALDGGDRMQIRDSRSGALLAEVAMPPHVTNVYPEWMGNDRLLVEGAVGASSYANDLIVDVRGRTLAKLGDHEVGASAIHVGGDTWAIFLPNESVSIYDVRAGKRRRVIELPKDFGDAYVAAGPAKTMLLVNGGGGVASIDLERGKAVVTRPPVCS